MTHPLLTHSKIPVDRVVEILVRARNRIDSPSRWTQGRYYDLLDSQGPDDCPVCAAGAIRWALAGDPSSRNPLNDRALAHADRLVRDVGRILFERGAIHVTPIVEFNDAAGRTHAEVVDRFNIAICALLGDNGDLDGVSRIPNGSAEWRLDGDGGSWSYYVSASDVDERGDRSVSRLAEHGYDSALDAYMVLRGHLQLDPIETGSKALVAS